jgi:hypothetical protein
MQKCIFIPSGTPPRFSAIHMHHSVPQGQSHTTSAFI